MPAIAFDRFYRYADLTDLLQAFAREYPQLVAVESIGKSHEGRDIWVATVTNAATGPAADKPAFWVDGNIHATEVAASARTCTSCTRWSRGTARDADVTRALDTRAFYVCPRINPDGAEWALADQPKWIRSSTRPYPHGRRGRRGPDGRGRRRRRPHPADAHRRSQRRVEGASGRAAAHDPPRADGNRRHLLPHPARGHARELRRLHAARQEARQGLDLNRNFPASWRQEFEQLGAGPYPASEPEVRAVVDFIVRHPNVTGGTSFHTWSGVLLRPFEHQPDDEMHAEDLWVYQATGKKGTELTGYPNISVFHEFRYHPKDVIGGTFDWIYEHLGIYSWVVEIWSPMREAGITDYKYIDWFRDHAPEDDLKMLRWSDDKLGGLAHLPWQPFDHPQLGNVEIGGWNRFHAFSNPPPQFLERELERFPKWLLWQALISPKLELVHAGSSAAGGGHYNVTLVVQNTGWLPSYVSKRALERKAVRGLVAEIALPAGADLVQGKRRIEVGPARRAARTSTPASRSGRTTTSPTTA